MSEETLVGDVIPIGINSLSTTVDSIQQVPMLERLQMSEADVVSEAMGFFRWWQDQDGPMVLPLSLVMMLDACSTLSDLYERRDPS